MRQQGHAQAVAHQIGDGVDFVELDGFAHIQPVPLQEHVHQPAAERGAVVADEGLAGQQLAPGCLRRRLGHGQHHGLAQQGLPFQLRRQRERRADQHRQVDFAGIDMAQQRERHARHDAHAHIRVLGAQGRQGPHQQILLHRRNRAHAQQAADPAGAGHAHHAVGHGDQRLGLRQQAAAMMVQGGRLAGPLEQRHAQVFFQALDLCADGRLRQAEPAPGSREGAAARHGDKGFEFPDHNRFY